MTWRKRQVSWIGTMRFWTMSDSILSLQDHPLAELKKVNKHLLDLGKHYNAQFVATNDVHYIEQADAKYQDILVAIQTGALLKDPIAG
jgi:DNA polymerase III subunit alpha